MKGADYIAEFLAKQGVKHVFGITGGCIVQTFDAIGRRKGIDYIPVAHEQAAAMAADAYSRVTENFGVAIATSGPGATNLLTGVDCAYYDSIPIMLLTGQVTPDHLKGDTGVRQMGFQETDVVATFTPHTKYAAQVQDPKELRYELEKAAYLARSGRPGPVLLDLCENVQYGDIGDPAELRSFTPPRETKSLAGLERSIEEMFGLISEAERPVVILGGGIRLAGKIPEAREFVESLGLPYTLTWAAMDYLPQDSPHYTGGFGVTSPRDGNFAVANSDLLIAIGTRLDSHEAGPNPKIFARGAKKVVVDIDPTELAKYGPRGMHVDVPICADARSFFAVANHNLGDASVKDLSSWLEKIREWREKYPVCQPEYRELEDKVDPYVFINELSKAQKEGDVILTDCGSNLIWTMQGFKTKPGQRLISAWNNSPMGYAFPASIGAALGADRPVTCITGDGGFLMNIQELATMQRHRIPARIFVVNNHGYGIIKGTLDQWCEGRHHASAPELGLPDPSYVKIAQAFGIETETIENHDELPGKLRSVLERDGPILCEVNLPSPQNIKPKLGFGNPIEDSNPLLPRDEFREQMIVPPLEK